MKEKDVIDWFSHYFGYGYGTGEQYIIPALSKVMAVISAHGNYDHEELENAVGPAVFWLLLNVLCQANIFEYGTSPRYGWLSPKGIILQKYMDSHSYEELYNLVMVDSDYIHCMPDSCNCGEKGYQEGKKCNNPLF